MKDTNSLNITRFIILIGISFIVVISGIRLIDKALNIWSWTKTQEIMSKYNGSCEMRETEISYQYSIFCK